MWTTPQAVTESRRFEDQTQQIKLSPSMQNTNNMKMTRKTGQAGFSWVDIESSVFRCALATGEVTWEEPAADSCS